jgi:3-phosphoshikimate 1-carboxyvinyltransferase
MAQVPGDKSVSHRALIFGALAVGETRITGLLEGDDVLATAAAMRAFGAEVTRTGEGGWTVHGVGVGGLAEPGDVIDCGNAGTGVRLIMGMMATTPISATFTGDASLRRRPMGRILDPLTLFGARSAGRAGGLLPLTLTGAANPVPVEYTLPMPSAQVKSAVLLAGLNAPGETVVIEHAATRDHTERMLRGFGAEVIVEELPEGRAIRLTGQPELAPQRIAVPRDPSSAAFPVVAALIVEGSEITVPNICLNPTRARNHRAQHLPQSDPGRILPDTGRDGRRSDPREPPRGGRRAGRRPARAVLHAQGCRGAAGTCRQHDRRISGPGGARRLRRGRHGDARHRRIAGQGIRPDRRHGCRAARQWCRGDRA